MGGGCLTETGTPRPVEALGKNGAPTLQVGVHDQVLPLLTEGRTNSGMLNISAPAIRKGLVDCVHKVPKNIHFIWVGSPLKENHARNIVAIAEQNPAWSIYLWVDHDFEKQQEEELQKIAKRPGGGLFVKVWI